MIAAITFNFYCGIKSGVCDTSSRLSDKLTHFENVLVKIIHLVTDPVFFICFFRNDRNNSVSIYKFNEIGFAMKLNSW